MPVEIIILYLFISTNFTELPNAFWSLYIFNIYAEYACQIWHQTAHSSYGQRVVQQNKTELDTTYKAGILPKSTAFLSM